MTSFVLLNVMCLCVCIYVYMLISAFYVHYFNPSLNKIYFSNTKCVVYIAVLRILMDIINT
jgi:uncharacterized membrane protein